MRRISIILLAFAVVVVAGCGGGGSKGAFPTTTEATLPATTEAATTEPSTTEAVITTANLGGLTSATNCRELADLGQKFSAAFSGGANSQNLKTEAQVLKEFADKAPADIRDDFRVLAGYMQKLADAVGGLKPGQQLDAATLAKLQEVSTQIDQAKLSRASANIVNWVQKNCRG